MNPIITTVRNGKVDVPVEWPEGTEVRVEPASEAVGMREEDWDDSPEGIEAWVQWLHRLEPLVLTPEEEIEHRQFAEVMKRFNIEAVRRQFEQEPLE